jgi:hypothetical protein
MGRGESLYINKNCIIMTYNNYDYNIRYPTTIGISYQL